MSAGCGIYNKHILAFKRLHLNPGRVTESFNVAKKAIRASLASVMQRHFNKTKRFYYIFKNSH